MMTMQQHQPDVAPTDAAGRHPIAAYWTWIVDWASTCADYYAASATYEQLARLSNAELGRRGLSRETLARDIIETCEQRDKA